MKHIQITCDPSDWDASIIQGCNIPFNGRLLKPRQLAAADLPSSYLAIWHAMVERLQGLAPGEWAASLIFAERRNEPSAENGEETPPAGDEVRPRIHVTIYRHWDDGTTAEPVECSFDDEPVLKLFDWLVSPGAYGLADENN